MARHNFLGHLIYKSVGEKLMEGRRGPRCGWSLVEVVLKLGSRVDHRRASSTSSFFLFKRQVPFSSFLFLS